MLVLVEFTGRSTVYTFTIIISELPMEALFGQLVQNIFLMQCFAVLLLIVFLAAPSHC